MDFITSFQRIRTGAAALGWTAVVADCDAALQRLGAADPLIPHLPSGKFHEPPPQSRPYDFVRRSKMAPRAVPWTVPYAAPGVLAFSKNGTKPSIWYDYHLFGPRTYLYGELQNFTNGRSDPINKEFGDNIDQVVDWQKQYPDASGPRGICRPGVYVSVISHPFLDLSGNYNLNLPFIVTVGHNREVGGGYSDGRWISWGFVPGTKNYYQTCINKADRTFMYAAEVNGNIVKIDRTLGKGGGGKTEDATKYVVSTAWTARAPTAVDTHTNGDVYYCDQGDVYKNGTRLIAGTGANALVVDSPRNRVLVLTGSMQLLAYDLSGVKLFGTTVQVAGLAVPGTDFQTIDVDENGTCGPAGTIRVSRVHTNGNVNLWEISPDGATVKFGQAITSSMQGWNVCGPLKDTHEWYGHYVWINHFHRYQGCYIKGGYGDSILSVAVCDPPLPQAGLLDYRLVWTGLSALAEAGLTSVVSSQGESPYAGCSYDELAELPFDTIFANLCQGLITETPRPELNGPKGWMAVCAIAVNSQRAMREGKVYVDSAFAWATTKGLKPTDYPSILNGGHFTHEPSPVIYYETNGTDMAPTDAGRSTPIRYAWPPINILSGQSIAGQTIVNDRGVVYCSPGPTRARVA